MEDQSIIALATAARTRADGYDVQVARSGEHAIDLVERAAAAGERFDLVLMDIDLGAGIDGVEAARRILARYEMPIVFLTGHSEPEYVDRVRAVTRYGYVLKTSGDLILRLSIEMALDLFAANRTSRLHERELQAIYDHAPIMMLVVDADGRVLKANRFASPATAGEASPDHQADLATIVRCIASATDETLCEGSPSCDECGLRRLLREAIERGTVHREVRVRVPVSSDDGAKALRLCVSTTPIGESGGAPILVSVANVDSHTDSGHNGPQDDRE